MLNERLFLSFRHVMYSLRGGFLVRPLIIALALGCAGALLSALEETVPGLSAWAPRVVFPSHEDPQVAQVVLSAIATSMMTVVSIVFAILLMTLTLASMQFSPRIIVSFARGSRDPADARHLPRHLLVLRGGASGGALGPAPLRARPDRPRLDAARAGLRRMADLLHPPHLAGDQRQPHRGKDRQRDGGDHRAPCRSHARRHDGSFGGRPAGRASARARSSSEVSTASVRFIDGSPRSSWRSQAVPPSFGAYGPTSLRESVMMAVKGGCGYPHRCAEFAGSCRLGADAGRSSDIEFGILRDRRHRAPGDLAGTTPHRHQDVRSVERAS